MANNLALTARSAEQVSSSVSTVSTAAGEVSFKVHGAVGFVTELSHQLNDMSQSESSSPSRAGSDCPSHQINPLAQKVELEQALELLKGTLGTFCRRAQETNEVLALVRI